MTIEVSAKHLLSFKLHFFLDPLERRKCACCRKIGTREHWRAYVTTRLKVRKGQSFTMPLKCVVCPNCRKAINLKDLSAKLFQ